MTIQEAIKERHSVRRYQEKMIPPEVRTALEKSVEEVNRETGLHLQLIWEEPKAFKPGVFGYGFFHGVRNYLVLAGKESEDLEEKCGYYGEKILLEAQMLGLNSCWVGLTYRKIPGTYTLDEGERLVLVAALGYGLTSGSPHRNKPLLELADLKENDPDWYQEGVRMALLAPTAVNQQKFHIGHKGEEVSITAGSGPFSRVDLGIVRYHFEAGAGKSSFHWK